MKWELVALMPESQKQRGFFEAAIIRVFYKDVYKLGATVIHSKRVDVRERVLQFLMGEEREMPDGTYQMVRASTKGRKALNTLVERAVQYLQDNGYKVPNSLLYKHWDSHWSMRYSFDEYLNRFGYEIDEFPRPVAIEKKMEGSKQERVKLSARGTTSSPTSTDLV